MNMKKILLASLLAAILLLSACADKEPDGSDRETFPKESYVTVMDGDLTHQGGLDKTDYTADSTVGEWLISCSASDRDEQFDAYTLRRDVTADGSTTFTYMIYYPHGTAGMTAEAELLEGESGGYILNITYTAGGSDKDYCLDIVTFTLPTDKAPRVRLLYDGNTLGQMATVTDGEF